MKPFLDIGQNPGDSQNRKNSSLISDGSYLKTKDVPYRRLGQTNLVCVQQIRMDHNHAHGRP